jgi:hypothetical protein
MSGTLFMHKYNNSEQPGKILAGAWSFCAGNPAKIWVVGEYGFYDW